MEQQSGVFLVKKPLGMTTNKLIQHIKHQLQIKKIGHAGTLDPLAEGLVLVLVNQATKLSPFLLNETKNYTATIELFTATVSGDREGEISKTEAPRIIPQSQIKALAKKFTNYHYEQEPPIYSAIKVQGKKLYHYARNHEAVIIPKRPVTIKEFKVDHYNPQNHTLTFTATVSKGTYIRALGNEIAQALGTVGHIIKLTRNQSGNFKLKHAKNWEMLEWNDLIKLYDVLCQANYPIVTIKDSVNAVLRGQPILLPEVTAKAVFLANAHQEILAYYGHKEGHLYYCLRGGFNCESS